MESTGSSGNPGMGEGEIRSPRIFPSEWMATFILAGLSAVAAAAYPLGHPGTARVLGLSLANFFLWTAWLGLGLTRWGGSSPALFLRGFMPWVATALSYGLMRYLVPLVHPSDYDGALRGVENWLWGSDSAHWCAVLSKPSWTGPFCLLYLGVFPWLIGFFLHFCLRHSLLFQRAMTGLLLVYLGGFIGYMAVPAEGPCYAFPGEWAWRGKGRIPDLTYGLVGHMGSHLDVFPSLHAAFVAYLLLWQAAVHKRSLVWGLPMALGVLVSTLTLGFHYFPDLIAGSALGILAYLAAPWLEKKLGDWDFLFFSFRRQESEIRTAGMPAEPARPSTLELP